MRKFLTLFLIIVAVIFISGCAISSKRGIEVSCNDGIRSFTRPSALMATVCDKECTIDVEIKDALGNSICKETQSPCVISTVFCSSKLSQYIGQEVTINANIYDLNSKLKLSDTKTKVVP